MSEHYFSPHPGSTARPAQVTARIWGHELALQSVSGVFSHGRVDLGTGVLLRTSRPDPSARTALDLGCGYGLLTVALGVELPQARVWAVDVNERALDLLRRTAQRHGLTSLRAVTPQEVPPDVQFEAIWSNPPIRVGKEALHSMLELWLQRLAPGAAAHLVVQRNLGADSLQRWLQDTLDLRVDRVASAKGYRVLRVWSPPV